LGTATRVVEKRASEVDDRLGNRGAGSRTRLETDECLRGGRAPQRAQ
jgi:hypothetical protein